MGLAIYRIQLSVLKKSNDSYFYIIPHSYRGGVSLYIITYIFYVNLGRKIVIGINYAASRV